MHELGIAQDFWTVIKQYAEQNKLKAISKITIVLGEASGIEEDFLRHSLKDHILPGTIGENAEIVVVPVKLLARCNDCEKPVTREDMKGLACPHCGSGNIKITSGKETHVESIEGE